MARRRKSTPRTTGDIFAPTTKTAIVKRRPGRPPVHEEAWTKDNLNTELTRALTTLENARMEWNSARLKFAVLNGDLAAPAPAAAPTPAGSPMESLLRERNYAEMCRLGLALTWPIALAALAIFLVLLLRR